MISLNQKKDWLEKALSVSPNVIDLNKSPISIGKVNTDPGTFFKYAYLEEKKLIQGEKISFDASNEIILDFGEHLTGYLNFDVILKGQSMGGPLRLNLIFAEIPDELHFPFVEYKGSLSKAWLQEEIITLEYLPQTVRINRRVAFRYVKIQIESISFDYEIIIQNINCSCITSGDHNIKKYVSQSLDKQMQEIELVGLRTLRNTMFDTFIDGPKRDKRLWLGDFPLQAKVNYYTFGNFEIVKRCLYLFASQIREDGKMPACLYTIPDVHHGPEYIPDFAVLFGSYLLDYAEASDDYQTARDLFPSALLQVEIIIQHLNKNAIIENTDDWWIFIDWCPELSKEAPFHAVIINALKKLVRLAELLEINEKTDFLKDTINKMIIAAKNYYYDADKKVFFSKKNERTYWSTQVWMALAEVAEINTTKEILIDLLKDKTVKKPVTPFIYHYTLEALFNFGLKDEAVNLLNEYWGGMIDKGATTFWEVFDNSDPFFSPYGDYLINSYCHSWSCTPPYFTKKYLKGK